MLKPQIIVIDGPKGAGKSTAEATQVDDLVLWHLMHERANDEGR